MGGAHSAQRAALCAGCVLHAPVSACNLGSAVLAWVAPGGCCSTVKNGSGPGAAPRDTPGRARPRGVFGCAEDAGDWRICCGKRGGARLHGAGPGCLGVTAKKSRSRVVSRSARTGFALRHCTATLGMPWARRWCRPAWSRARAVRIFMAVGQGSLSVERNQSRVSGCLSADDRRPIEGDFLDGVRAIHRTFAAGPFPGSGTVDLGFYRGGWVGCKRVGPFRRPACLLGCCGPSRVRAIGDGRVRRACATSGGFRS